MFRNDEFNRYLIWQAVITLLTTTLAWLLIDWITASIVFVAIFLSCLNFIYFTRWRYAQLEQLSNYLQQIASGKYQLDVRDNVEGELSILKNEIYKVTVRLSQQSEYLTRDRQRMSDAIADISHQLKTPLTSMGVMLDALNNPNLPSEQQMKFMKSLQQQLDRLDWLITSLLKISKLDAGTVTFQEERVTLEALIEQVLKPLEIPIELKEIEISIDGDQQLEIVVDPKWTIEALLNVVKNAVDHTPVGGKITLKLGHNLLYNELIVIDSGSGIAKEDIPHIFKRFYRGKRHSESSVGIGLSLTSRIMESQGGTIYAANSSSGGAEFTLKWYHK